MTSMGFRDRRVAPAVLAQGGVATGEGSGTADCFPPGLTLWPRLLCWAQPRPGQCGAHEPRAGADCPALPGREFKSQWRHKTELHPRAEARDPCATCTGHGADNRDPGSSGHQEGTAPQALQGPKYLSPAQLSPGDRKVLTVTSPVCCHRTHTVPSEVARVLEKCGLRTHSEGQDRAAGGSSPGTHRTGLAWQSWGPRASWSGARGRPCLRARFGR